MFRLMTSLLESFKNLLESGRHLNLCFAVTCSTTFICRASSLFLFLCFSPVLGDTRALCGRFLSSIRRDAQRLRSKYLVVIFKRNRYVFLYKVTSAATRSPGTTSTRSSSCILPSVLSHCSHCTVGTSVKDGLKREDEINCLRFPNHESLERLSSAARNSVVQRQNLFLIVFSNFFQFLVKNRIHLKGRSCFVWPI